MPRDHYEVLGVRRDASQADIQKAYRELARKHHPDLNPDDAGAKQRFQEVQAAFDVLNDPKKRELFDRYGSAFEQQEAAAAAGAAGRGPRGAGPGRGGFEEYVDLSQMFGDEGGGGGFADLFSQFRGGGRRAPARGADLAAELTIPFSLAVTGGAQRLSLQRDGHVDTIDVKIPAGIEAGKKIRLRGQGEPSPRGGTAGDLLVTIDIEPHPYFHRHGHNLHVRAPVTLAEAAAGAKIDVPTPQGTVSLRVPAGSSTGKKLRVKGHGVPAGRGHDAGDLIVELQVALPTDWSAEDLEKIRQLDAKHPLEPRRDLRW